MQRSLRVETKCRCSGNHAIDEFPIPHGKIRDRALRPETQLEPSRTRTLFVKAKVTKKFQRPTNEKMILEIFTTTSARN